MHRCDGFNNHIFNTTSSLNTVNKKLWGIKNENTSVIVKHYLFTFTFTVLRILQYIP